MLGVLPRSHLIPFLITVYVLIVIRARALSSGLVAVSRSAGVPRSRQCLAATRLA